MLSENFENKKMHSLTCTIANVLVLQLALLRLHPLFEYCAIDQNRLLFHRFFDDFRVF